MKNAPIYLDFNASTPLDPRVAEVMQDMLSDAYGNPSSTHWAGEPARVAVERARRQVADLLGCKPQEVIFTSGGSESNNMAIKGIAEGHDPEQVHIITSQVEHPAVTEPCLYLERRGATITWLPADRFGQVKPADVEAAIRPQTTLVTIMHANNEVGTIQPIEDIARIASAHGVPMHTDAAQSVGKISTRVDELGVDMLTIAGHKLYAPKGVGALFVREGIELPPLVHGAGHDLVEACTVCDVSPPNVVVGPQPKKVEDIGSPRYHLGSILNSIQPHKNKTNIQDPNWNDLLLKNNKITDHNYVFEIPEWSWLIAKRQKRDKGYMGQMSFPEDMNKIARTIMAFGTSQSREAFILPHSKNKYRKPTIREYATLMSFPINYQFSGVSHPVKKKQIGNAVPPKFSFELARAIQNTDVLNLKRLQKGGDISNGFVDLTNQKFVFKKQSSRKFRIIFDQQIPYLKIKSYRVVLDNRASDWDNRKIKWKIS